MNAVPEITCSKCGRVVRSNDPEPLCPTCLMTATMETNSLADDGLLVLVDDEDECLGEPTPDAPQAFGGYRLVKVLGKGGMGVVYEAEQVSTGRRVALKMLGRQLNSPEIRRRFLREGRLAAGVSHPNSVYVFGTEEIEGLPVITMEVAGGGTLQDALDRRGQLPVVEAVDAMLDVIRGLHTALGKGVLHRDIKPSNCFVGPDGRAKIGDFGLSVSTMTSVDTFATATGVALGTPAFASPEQLRGNDLDHRSDIYAIGSTLYTLLAGVPPFRGTNAVQIVAAVLDQVPDPVTLIRTDVPVELASVVSRCLAKKAEARFADYHALQTALLPFSSRLPEPEPAPRVRRTLAGLIDVSIAWTIPQSIMAASAGALYIGELWHTPRFWIYMAISVIWYLTYYGIFEGIRDASPGKWLLGLKVVTRKRRRIGIRRALGRSVLSLLSIQNFLALQWLVALGWLGNGLPRTYYGLIFLALGLGMAAIPALTMRRRNGYSMMWDKLTRSRVVMVAPAIFSAAAPSRQPLAATVEQQPPMPHCIGPYQVQRTIVDGWIEAIDPDLDRLIWLRHRNGAVLSPARRDAARPTRLRWLQSVTDPHVTWDAWEAKSGVPISALIHPDGVHWQSVRHWLYDVVIELASATKDETLPSEVTMDHLWITHEGRAVLLDVPYPNDDSRRCDSTRFDVAEITGQQAFLNAIAKTARRETIPVSARSVLDNLAEHRFDRLSFLAGNIRSLLAKPARIDRASRATALLTVPIFFLATLIITGQANEQSYRAAASRWSEARPGLPPLSEVLRNRQMIANEVGRLPLRIHLAGHYADLKDKHNFFGDRSDFVATLGDNASNQYLQELLRVPTSTSATELRSADRMVVAALRGTASQARRFRWLGLARFGFSLMCVLGLLQLPVILCFGTTLGQIVFSYEVVADDGRRVGRTLLLARWFIVFAPVALTLWLTTFSGWFYVILLPWMYGLAIAIHDPARGPQERLTGTWLIPR